MDWTTPLRSQQADFIQRLKSGHLLHCEVEGQHSELTVISGERLKQLRDFCWVMAEKYKKTSKVRDVFINNLKGKLGEEVVKSRLGNFVTEVDYEKRLGGDGKVDFTLTSNPSVGLQVKARHGNPDTVCWSISKEEVERNAVLVCILIQEDVSEAQAEYNLVLAGFISTDMIEDSNNGAFFRINELLYGAGLNSYLESISSNPDTTFLQKAQEESEQISSTELSLTINIDSWKYTLPPEQLINLETAIKEFREKSEHTIEEVKNKEIQPSQLNDLNKIWQDLLSHVSMSSKALLKEHCYLISFDCQEACIGVRNQKLLEMTQSKLLDIEAALEKAVKFKARVNLQLIELNEPQTHSDTNNLQDRKSQERLETTNWNVGDWVTHQTLGDGKITHIFGSGNKKILEVRFVVEGQRILDPKTALLEPMLKTMKEISF